MSLRWNAIRAALDTKLAAFATPGGYLVNWQGLTFQGPNTGSWLEANMIPATVEHALTLSGETHERGIYQVSIFVAAGVGAGTLFSICDALSAHFDRARLTGVGVTVQCDVPVPGPVLQEPDWIHLPLSINFLAL